MRRAITIPGLLLALALPAAAKDMVLGEYDISGSHSKRGAFGGELRVSDEQEGTDLVLKVRYPSGSTEVVSGRVWKTAGHEADGERSGDELRVRASGTASLVGALAGSGIGSTGVLTYRLTDPATGTCTVQVTFSDGTTLSATGKKMGPELKDLAGHLLVYNPDALKADAKALVKKELKQALKEGIDVRETLKLHDFFHVGIGGEVALLDDMSQTLDQRATLLANPGKMWLVTSVEGGIRLPLGVTIPIGGAANVSLGLQPGVELKYEIVDIYDRPVGISDLKESAKAVGKTLKAIGRRTVDLPLEAAEAEAMVPGAERTIEGALTVAVSGALGVGYDTKELNDIVEVGASAHVGGFYRIRRDLRLGVSRLSGKSVRVRLENGKGTSIGADARAFVGASINDDAVVEQADSVEYLEPVIELAANGVDKLVKKVFRFELKGTVAKDQSSGVDVCWKLDLAKAGARLAYDRAVRGDFTMLDRLAAQDGSGVELEFRVLDVERHAYTRAELTVSLLVEGQLSKDAKDQVFDVVDGDKLTRYEVFRFQQRRALGLFGFVKSWQKKWDEALFVEAIRAKPNNAAAAVALNLPHWIPQRRSLTLRYDLRDPFTRKKEMARMRRTVAAWGLDDVNAIPTPDKKLLQARWGKTETHIVLEVAEAGVYVLVQKLSDDEIKGAFLSAHSIVHDEQPGSEKAQEKAGKFLAHIRGLGPGSDTATRAKHLRELCEEAGWDLTAATAIKNLVPASTQRVQVAIDGKRIDFDGERVGRKYVPFVPVLPGN